MPLNLLISDGMVEEFSGTGMQRPRKSKAAEKGRAKAGVGSARGGGTGTDAIQLSADGEALAVRLREWRALEAKKLKVPAFLVMHDRTLNAVAHRRPGNPRQLLEIDGLGPAKVEKFGAAILKLCVVGE
jgi:superfamily II DNA helicase RecQ